MASISDRASKVLEELNKYIPSSYLKLLTKVKKSLEAARILNERRMIVLCGDSGDEVGAVLTKTLLYYLKWAKKSRKIISGLYMYHPEFPESRVKKEIIEGTLSTRRVKSLKIEFSHLQEADKYLGTTYDLLVLDLTENLKPNDLGRLIGIVRGGGLIVLLTPNWNSWSKKLTLFQRTLATPQHPEEEVRQVFKPWFTRKLLEHRGIFVYDVDNRRVVKQYVEDFKVQKKSLRGITIPRDVVFPEKLYKLALTQDQVEVIRLIEKFIDKPRGGKRRTLILTADRGRGKSCALGIAIVGLISELLKVKNRVRVVVTAPNPTNVQPLFQLAIKALETLNIKYRVLERKKWIIEVKGEKYSIEYWDPINVPKLRSDIVAVDEAAGLQVPMLHSIHKAHKRVLYSSTIHGYEGAGRGFSIRFLKALREDPKVEILEYEMREPIRYSESDPIEKWQFDTLLLDAEPARISEEDLKDLREGRLEYVKPSLKMWFSKEGENMLRQFFGIYVLAHYRNEPDDLAMMADAPHHTIRALRTKSGSIVSSVQLAEEGPIPESMLEDLLKGGHIPGNIIPDRLLKHSRIREIGLLKGWRIVRIATHPELMSRGIGSRMLSELEKEAKRKGYDWLGSGFGVNPRLLKFWIKNGYIPVHMSPDRNPVSGEYTLIVVKPLTEEAKKLIQHVNIEFKKKLLYSLHDTYRDLEVEVVHMLLTTGLPVEESKPKLSKVQWDRARIYSYGPMTYEAACDVVVELAKAYFKNPHYNRPSLSREEELVLIARVLQARTWSSTVEAVGFNRHSEVMSLLKSIVKKFLKFYTGELEPLGISFEELEY